MKCKYCGNPIRKDVEPLYSGHCSWTCLSRHRKEKEAERREKEDVKYKKAMETSDLKQNAKRKTTSRPKKAILQLNAKKEVLRRFECARDAADAMGSCESNIYHACRSDSQHRGFWWKYDREVKNI